MSPKLDIFVRLWKQSFLREFMTMAERGDFDRSCLENNVILRGLLRTLKE